MKFFWVSNFSKQGSGSLSAEELKQRQDFLKQQRDRLIEMKQKEREKQLLSAEKQNPKQRPSSARAARSVLKQGGAGPNAPKADDKQLAMRRAIANRLKEEVIGKPWSCETQVS